MVFHMVMPTKQYVKVSAKSGEFSRKVLLEAGLLDQDFKIEVKDGMLYLPIHDNCDTKTIIDTLGLKDIETGTMQFSMVHTGPKTLIEALGDKLTPNQIELLPRAYDLIGDIAVLEIPEELQTYATDIGEAFLSLHKNFSTVLAKKGAISGTTRIRDYTILAGERKTNTIHIEYGCRIAVDLACAYFSPRLLEEHNRVAKQVTDNEHIIDMFTGVGPFALHIAKTWQSHIVAIDINPQAISLLQESISMNRLIGTIEPIVADAHQYVSDQCDEQADRIIMNHPSGASEFINDACKILRRGGIIHYYDFIGGSNPEEKIQVKITQLVEQAGRIISKLSKVRRVRDSAPYEYQMVVDVIID